MNIVCTRCVVEFGLWAVEKDGKDVPCQHIFNWSTASEINTNTFELQRLNSLNNYETIATINAQNKANNYSFTMNNPLKGIN